MITFYFYLLQVLWWVLFCSLRIDEKLSQTRHYRQHGILSFSFIFCLFIFWFSLFYEIGFLLGDPQRLVNPTDSNGGVCGYDTQLKDRPYLLFFDLTRCASPTVLTNGCPTPQVQLSFVYHIVCLFQKYCYDVHKRGTKNNLDEWISVFVGVCEIVS